MLKVASWRDGHKGTRSSDSSRQKWKLVGGFEDKEKLTWGRGLGLGRGASGKSTAGRRCCGTRRCKSQSPEQVPKNFASALWAARTFFSTTPTQRRYILPPAVTMPHVHVVAPRQGRHRTLSLQQNNRPFKKKKEKKMTKDWKIVRACASITIMFYLLSNQWLRKAEATKFPVYRRCAFVLKNFARFTPSVNKNTSFFIICLGFVVTTLNCTQSKTKSLAMYECVCIFFPSWKRDRRQQSTFQRVLSLLFPSWLRVTLQQISWIYEKRQMIHHSLPTVSYF